MYARVSLQITEQSECWYIICIVIPLPSDYFQDTANPMTVPQTWNNWSVSCRELQLLRAKSSDQQYITTSTWPHPPNTWNQQSLGTLLLKKTKKNENRNDLFWVCPPPNPWVAMHRPCEKSEVLAVNDALAEPCSVSVRIVGEHAISPRLTIAPGEETYHMSNLAIVALYSYSFLKQPMLLLFMLFHRCCILLL